MSFERSNVRWTPRPVGVTSSSMSWRRLVPMPVYAGEDLLPLADKRMLAVPLSELWER